MHKKIVLTLVIFTLVLSGCSSKKPATEDPVNSDINNEEIEKNLEDEKPDESNIVNNEIDEEDNKDEVKENILTKTEAVKIEEEFNNRLYQSTTEDYEVKNFNSKEELIDHISEIANRDLVTTYVEYFYKKENEKLMINPTEAAPKLILDKPYTLSKIFDNRYELVQENKNELYGEYKLTIYFTFSDGKWIIDDRDVELKND